MKYVTAVGDQTYVIEINREGEITVDGVTRRADLRSIDGLGTYSLLIDDESHEALVETRGGEIGVLLRGQGTRAGQRQQGGGEQAVLRHQPASTWRGRRRADPAPSRWHRRTS